MLRKPNKIQMIAMSSILVMNTLFSAGLALGATVVKPDSASIAITVTAGDSAKTPVKDLTVSMKDAPVSDAVVTVDNTKATGEYDISGIKVLGDYHFNLTDTSGKIIETIPVSVKSFNAADKPIKVSTTWLTSSTVTAAKAGAIGGYITDGATTPKAVAEAVYIVGTKATWTVNSDVNGSFKAYVPTGKYTLVIPGTAKNTSNDVTVAAGQMASPLADLATNATWTATADKQLGLNTTAIKATDKTIAGSANAKCLVVATAVYGSTTTFLGSAIADAKNTFKITLKTIQPGQYIKVTAQDAALNIATDPVYTGINSATTSNTGLLTAVLAADTTATIATDIKIGVTDATKMFVPNVTQVVYNDGHNDYTLAKTTYSLTKNAGKLTILAGTIPIGTAYSFNVTSTGFNPATLTGQEVKTSKTAAVALAGTVVAGSTAGTTKLTVSSTVYSNYTFKVTVGSAVYTGFKGNLVPSGATAFTSGTDIAIGPNNKNIGLYEVDSNGVIYAFKAFAVTAIKAPVLTAPTSALTVSGSVYTIKLKVDTKTLDTTKAPAAAFKITSGTSTTGKTITSVTITNGTSTDTSDVVIVFSDTANAIDTVKLVYTKPTSGGLQDANGNAVATTTFTSISK